MIETADDQVARERLNAALEADSSGEALQFDDQLYQDSLRFYRPPAAPNLGRTRWFRVFLSVASVVALVWAFK